MITETKLHEFFRTHPKTSEVFETAGVLFLDEGQAKLYQSVKKSEAPKCYTRNDVLTDTEKAEALKAASLTAGDKDRVDGLKEPAKPEAPQPEHAPESKVEEPEGAHKTEVGNKETIPAPEGEKHEEPPKAEDGDEKETAK